MTEKALVKACGVEFGIKNSTRRKLQTKRKSNMKFYRKLHKKRFLHKAKALSIFDPHSSFYDLMI